MTVTWTAGGTDDYHIVVDWWDYTAYTLQVDFIGPRRK